MGPQWSLGVGSEESLIELSDKSILVTSSNGGQTVFAAVFNSKGETTGKFEAPPGDSNLTMTLEENEKKEKVAYYLKDPAAGTSTKFTFNSTTKVWLPAEQTGPVSMDTVSYSYETVEVGGKKVTRPEVERGATPAKVSCPVGKMELGCRAFIFTYATKTKSGIGEGPTEWGEYVGRLVKVSFEGYNPATKKMTETPIPVAEYAYDKQGRLRAEWDPRISPALKTTYGYDAEGHVTALNPPGQEPWAFTYGATAGDAGTGRLLKVRRAAASEGLWNGETVKNSAPPGITGTPYVGSQMGVSNGTWSSGFVSYSYQWEDCSISGTECKPILGANSENYTPVMSDAGHTLVAVVTGTNGSGSVTAASAHSGEVKLDITEHSLPSGSEPEGIALGPDSRLWFTNPPTNKIGYMTAAGNTAEFSLNQGSSHYAAYGITPSPEKEDAMLLAVHGPKEPGQERYGYGKVTLSGPAGTITGHTRPSGDHSEEVTEGPESDLWFTDSEKSVIGKMTPSGEVTEYTLPKGSAPDGITPGPQKENALWFTAYGSHKIGRMTTSGEITKEYELPSGSEPYGIVAGPGTENALWFTEFGSDKVGRITTAGVIKEYKLLTGESAPISIAVGPDGDLWFAAENTSKVGSITPSGEIKEYSLPAKSRPSSIIAGPDGNLWFTEEESNKIGKIYTSGQGLREYELPSGSSPVTITVGQDHRLWFTEDGTSKIGSISTSSGKITEYSAAAGSHPYGITAGPEDEVWFADYGTDNIESITTGTITNSITEEGENGDGGGPKIAVGPEDTAWLVGGQYNDALSEVPLSGGITEHALPSGDHSEEVAEGPEHDLWFTDAEKNTIGKMTLSGEVTEYSLPAGSEPHAIVAGPEGPPASATRMWFTETREQQDREDRD